MNLEVEWLQLIICNCIVSELLVITTTPTPTLRLDDVKRENSWISRIHDINNNTTHQSDDHGELQARKTELE